MTVEQLRDRGALSEQDLNIQASIGFPANQLAELRLHVSFMPHAEIRAFELHVIISGAFITPQGVSHRNIAKILGVLGGNILFPFAREVIMSTLGRGVFGQLAVQPVRLESLFNEEYIAAIAD